MRSIPIADFEINPAEVLETVAATGEEVVVTKAGKPIARIEPVPSSEHCPTLGAMRGSMTIVGDIVAPLDPEDWGRLHPDFGTGGP